MTNPFDPGSAMLLVAAYLDRDPVAAERVIDHVASEDLPELLGVLRELGEGVYDMVTNQGLSAVRDVPNLDQRVLEVIGQMTDLDGEAALQVQLQRYLTGQSLQCTERAPTAALAHMAAGFLAVLLEATTPDPVRAAQHLRNVARAG